MAVMDEVLVVSATPAIAGRSRAKRPASSAARCCASAALPPLPQKYAVPPFFRQLASACAAFSTSLAHEAAVAAIVAADASRDTRTLSPSFIPTIVLQSAEVQEDAPLPPGML